MIDNVNVLAKENKNISDFHLRGESDISYRLMGDIVIVPDSKITDKDLNYIELNRQKRRVIYV